MPTVRRAPELLFPWLFCLLAACATAGVAWAQAPRGTAPKSAASSGSIYSCTAPDGRRLTSDRPIPECSAREQNILNADGSVRGVVPPAMSPEERAAHEARERKRAAERQAKADAVRRDRNLMMRYRDAATHQRARAAALDDVQAGMRLSEKRLKELDAERKPLLDEAEFYKGKPLPSKLKQQLDANEAAAGAQRELIDNQKTELVRVNRLYDVELERLRKLWSGAAPGSLD